MTRILPRLAAALALAASLLPAAVRADSPTNGQSLFTASCTGSGCHGSSPLTSNTNKIYNGRNARAAIDSAISNVGQMNSLRSAFPAGGSALADVAAYLGNTPTSLTFASTNVGSTSAAQTITVYSSYKSSSYALNSINVTTSGDFARAGGTCGTSLAYLSNCTITVTFTPTAAGTRTGTLTLSHSGTLSPITFSLSGTGAAAASAPAASVSPASLTFPSTAIGSASASQNVTVSNTGNAALSISAISYSNADFVTAGGTCAAGGTVAAGGSCTLAVAFQPRSGATGSRTGTVSFTHNATGSPSSVSLSGTAAAAPAPVASLTTSLAFGSVNVGSTGATQTATLSNTGNAALTIGTIGTGSSEFGITGGSCAAGASVAAGASCTVNLAFTPASSGARSATLTITHNASGGQSTTALSGTGVALTPAIALSPTTLSFSQVVGSTSAAQQVTISNTGTAALAISALTLGGAQAADYALASGGTCTAGGSVAAGGSCTVRLQFTPGATGTRSGTLTVSHNASGSPSTVTLNGTGTAAPQPAVSLNAASLSFASQVVGSTSAAQTVTVTNSGSATLTLSGLTLTGATGDFSRSGTCTASSVLAVGGSCTVGFSFTPSAVGTRTATLTLASDAANGNAVLSLSGTGAAAPTPAVGLSPASLDFGNQTVGATSAARTVTLSNTGSGALSISGITASAGFGVSHNCGASVAAGASCALSVTFTPAATGAATGTLSVASNASGSPATVSLAGSGVAAAPVLTWSPPASGLTFGDVAVGSSATASVLTLANQGPGSVTLQQLAISGAQAADFSVAAGSTCAANLTLAQGASCTLSVAFQPAAAGARSASLQVVSTGTSPAALALSGTGSAAAQPAAAVVPSVLNFIVTAGNAAADPQVITLQSTGSAVLHVSAVAVGSGTFSVEAAASNGCPAAPFDLLPGQSCSLAVTWPDTTAASATGELDITTTAAADPMRVTIQAVRAAGLTGTSMANAGAGGCSIAQGDSALDPTLWLLVALAAAVLAWRRRSAAAR